MADDTRQAREEFQQARRMLVDKLVADHPGLNHKDFDDVALADFDDHAAGLVTQLASADREAAARAMGMTPDEFDTFQAERAKGAEGSQESGQSTPQSRTANLPSGKPPTIPPPARTADGTGGGAGGGEAPLTGLDLIEQKASEDIAEWTTTGKWPTRQTDTFG